MALGEQRFVGSVDRLFLIDLGDARCSPWQLAQGRRVSLKNREDPQTRCRDRLRTAGACSEKTPLHHVIYSFPGARSTARLPQPAGFPRLSTLRVIGH
jgi:hypothetical protein